MSLEENAFVEYLQLQATSDLVTKSELITEVRAGGNSISDRQLTFYVSEGLVPRSVRVGTRAGVYPSIVVELLSWILTCRDRGVPIEALKELVPVWKFLVEARRKHRLDLAELEYVARQHVSHVEGNFALPMLVSDVLRGCSHCRGQVTIVHKDGAELSIDSPEATVGFAYAQRSRNDEGQESLRWVGQTRISLACVSDIEGDPTTIIHGVKPNEALPPALAVGTHSEHPGEEVNAEEAEETTSV